MQRGTWSNGFPPIPVTYEALLETARAMELLGPPRARMVVVSPDIIEALGEPTAGQPSLCAVRVEVNPLLPPGSCVHWPPGSKL